MSDYVARLEAAHALRAEHGTYDFTYDDDDVRAALDELKQLRAQVAAESDWAIWWVGDDGEPYDKQFLQEDEAFAREIYRNNHTNGRGDARLMRRPAGEWVEAAAPQRPVRGGSDA